MEVYQTNVCCDGLLTLCSRWGISMLWPVCGEREQDAPTWTVVLSAYVQGI